MVIALELIAVAVFLIPFVLWFSSLLIPIALSYFMSSSVREQSIKDKNEIEAKYAARDAQLLDDFNKHHG